MKKKQKHEDHVDEGWLLPYSDMLTLLLALFIVMFAMAKIDDKKFLEVQSEFSSILSSKSGGSPSVIGTVIDIEDNGNGQKGTLTAEQQKAQEAALIKIQNQAQQMQKTFERLNQELATSGLKDTAQVNLQSDGIHITLNSNILFEPGSSDITTNMNDTLTILSQALKILKDNPIIIAGHTDNIPQTGGKFANNWELSASRAISVMNYFVANKTIIPSHTSIQAYADSKPKSSNATAEGRAHNRRVELIIQKIDSQETTKEE